VLKKGSSERTTTHPARKKKSSLISPSKKGPRFSVSSLSGIKKGTSTWKGKKGGGVESRIAREKKEKKKRDQSIIYFLGEKGCRISVNKFPEAKKRISGGVAGGEKGGFLLPWINEQKGEKRKLDIGSQASLFQMEGGDSG